MKNVLASLITVGLIGGSQVLAEPPDIGEHRDEHRPVWRETDEMKVRVPLGPVEERRNKFAPSRASDKDESKHAHYICRSC